MKRRLFLALPLVAAIPSSTRTFRNECEVGVDDLPSHCLKCHNQECGDARGPERYLHRLPALLKRVPPGLLLRHVHVSPHVFERMVAESGQPAPPRLCFQPWVDQPIWVSLNSRLQDDDVKLFCYDRDQPIPKGRGSDLKLSWTTFRGHRVDSVWDHRHEPYVQVGKLVEV